jgi:hypothetical protein
MSPIKFAAFSTAALLATTALASAAVITQTASFGPSKTNWGTSGTSGTDYVPSQVLNFAGFNPSLGTLTGVSIVATESLTGSLDITNNGASSSEVTSTIENTEEVAGLPGVPDVTKKKYQATGTDSTGYSADLGSGKSSASGPLSATTSTTIAVTTDLSAYEAAWSADVGDLGQVLTSAADGDGSATYTDNGEVKLTVTYTYTPSQTSPPPPVPEPASLALLGSGLMGMGVLRRRRKAR